jgi:hypothetical protein
MSRSNGKYAQFISDRSGMAFPYKEMVVEWNGSRVHVSEYEAKQPQLEPKPTVADPQGLQFARPARVEPPVLILLQTNPFQTIIYSGTTYVNVYSPNHERSTGNIVRFRGPTSASGYLAVPSFNGVTDISNASGFTIIVGKLMEVVLYQIQQIIFILLVPTQLQLVELVEEEMVAQLAL